MKTVYILAILLVFVLLLVTYQSYQMSNLYYDVDYDGASTSPASSCNKDIQYSRMPAQPGQLRIESQPDGSADASAFLQEKSSVPLYDEDQYVYNKGFVNELIYKPEGNGLVPTAPSMIENTMPLNDPTCQLSSDLPIANINVNYFLDKETVKLR